jgi:hypothetical protein
VGLVAAAGEGDITVSRGGDEVYGTVTTAAVEPSSDGAERFVIEYEVDGGQGAYEDAGGRATASGVFRGDVFEGRWSVDLAPPTART